jgi:hypothetical protein
MPNKELARIFLQGIWLDEEVKEFESKRESEPEAKANFPMGVTINTAPRTRDTAKRKLCALCRIRSFYCNKNTQKMQILRDFEHHFEAKPEKYWVFLLIVLNMFTKIS